MWLRKIRQKKLLLKEIDQERGSQLRIDGLRVSGVTNQSAARDGLLECRPSRSSTKFFMPLSPRSSNFYKQK